MMTNAFGRGSNAQIDTPQFPGWQEGLSQRQVQNIIKNQKRIKGFQIAVATGETITNIELSGTARVFIGFALQPIVKATLDDIDDYPQGFSLTINNEIIIDRVNPIFFGKDYTDEEYYQLIRPLSGQDTISTKFNNTNAATNFAFTVYYI